MLRTSFTGGLGQFWEYDFTISLSRVSFCVQLFVVLYQVFFSIFLLVSFYQKQIVVFCVFLLSFLCFNWLY